MGQQVNVYRKLKFWPGAVVEGFPGAYPGEGATYYVNNITGSTTADGLSWNSALSTVNAAITASEARRDLQATTNEYIRNTIIIQGTGTDHSAVATADCNYNDFVGLGANVRGDGVGICVISGSAGTTGAADAWSFTATTRGNSWYNIQFDGNGTSYCAFDATSILRSTWEECGFMGDAHVNAALIAGLRTTGALDGCTILDCIFGSNWAAPTSGISVGDSLGSTRIENCIISAATNGIIISTDGLTGQSVIKGCMIDAGTYGIRSLSAQTRLWIVGNYISSTDAISIIAGSTLTGEHMCLGNVVSNAGTIAWEAVA